MQITLHAATEQVRELLEQIDPETGEMPEGFEEARAIVQHKAVAVTAFLLESDKQAGLIEDYAKEMAAKAKTIRKRADWMKRYLAEHMAALGITEIKDERGLFKAKLSPGRDASVEIYDERQLPADYLREIPAKHEPDKVLIKKAISDGFEVPGARIVKKDRLTIG